MTGSKEFKSATFKMRQKALFFDSMIVLSIILILNSFELIGTIHKIGIPLLYILIIQPILISFGGSVGMLWYDLKVRKQDDHSQFISLSQAYSRLFLLIADTFTGRWKKKSVYEQISNTIVLEPVEDDSKELSAKDKIRFAFALIVYILWVIWLGNYWFLFGVLIVFDVYITKKLNWSPWKKREGQNSVIVEWFDALLFAVVAVSLINIFLFQNYRIPTGSMEKSLLIGDHLFVSKVTYGPKIPNTPLSMPFTQNVMPFSNGKRESYVKWIQWPDKRLKGIKTVKRDDVVVFNFPEGDTVVVGSSDKSYYGMVHEHAAQFRLIDINQGNPLKTREQYINQGREFLHKTQKIVVRPVDRRDNYIKRCVGIAGDTLQIINGQLYQNGVKQKDIENIQYLHWVNAGGKRLNSKILDKLDIYPDERMTDRNGNYLMPLTPKMVEELKKIPTVKSVTQFVEEAGKMEFLAAFPRHPNFNWNQDNFGPLYIPQEGATIDINMQNIPLYERIIGYYENNKLEIKDSVIYVNGEEANTYTFKQNYYWMMGDNRHRSLDSRFWGFVPENHIVGSPKFVWLSLDKNKSFPFNIRFKRFFKVIK